MDFVRSDDQRALTQGVRELLDGAFGPERLHEVENGFDAKLWGSLAETGVFSLTLPEDAAGLGLGLTEATLVFEELGAACVPGPLVASFLAASGPPGVEPGVVVTVVRPGNPLVVSHLEAAERVVVVGDDMRVVDPTGLSATSVSSPIDPLTPLHLVESLPSGDVVGDARDAERWRCHGALLTAALQVGLASRLTETAVAYAKQREQFGRTIGSFQAVKHLCADMLARTELARAAVEAAAVTVDHPEVGDAARAVAGAKLIADEAAAANGRSCIQVHGGMGITWEVVAHFYLKRAWVHATEFGTADEHAERLAELL